MFLQHYQKITFCIFVICVLLVAIPFVTFAAQPNDLPPTATANPPTTTAPSAPVSNPSGQPPPVAPQITPVPTPDAADAGLSPLVVKLEYIKADQVKAMLATVFPNNQIRAEIVNSTLVASGSDEDCAKVKTMLAKLDIPPRQVIFEAEAVEVSRDDVRNIGIDWGSVTALPSTAATEGSSFRLALGIPKHSEYGVNVAATIHHLVENKKGRLLASPRIAALDGQIAQILIGDKLAVESTQISNGTIVTTVTYVEVGIRLEVTPTIHEDGTITTHIKPEVSNKTDTTTSGNPNIRTRQAETTLRVKNGETIVIGGLIQRQETKDMIKFPLLGDIPIVGQFFRSTTKEKTESELIIMITPKLID